MRKVARCRVATCRVEGGQCSATLCAFRVDPVDPCAERGRRKGRGRAGHGGECTVAGRQTEEAAQRVVSGSGATAMTDESDVGKVGEDVAPRLLDGDGVVEALVGVVPRLMDGGG